MTTDKEKSNKIIDSIRKLLFEQQKNFTTLTNKEGVRSISLINHNDFTKINLSFSLSGSEGPHFLAQEKNILEEDSGIKNEYKFTSIEPLLIYLNIDTKKIEELRAKNEQSKQAEIKSPGM